jgi:hypothetical protein
MPDNQKKRSEEDFENKKLGPVLIEVFDLITKMEKNKKEV